MTIISSHDSFAPTQDTSHLSAHRRAAINWLKRAQDKTDNDGVGYGYYLRGNPLRRHGLGWRPSYVETSGYIIETFYEEGVREGDSDAASRAERIGRWLLSRQNTDGSFSNLEVGGERGLVFDTGQVLFGLVKCYEETNDPLFKTAAKRAARWLAGCLDENGAWRKNTHKSIIHIYNVRAAWAMLEYCKLCPDEIVKTAARQNLHWAAGQQNALGLFAHCSFDEGTAPFTHTIAYTVRGLFEGGLLLKDEYLISAARKAAESVSEYVEDNGFLPGRIGEGGTPDMRFCCLTGNAQMAIIWLKMGRLYNAPQLFNAGTRALDYVLETQNITTRYKNIKGAVKGSMPIWGRYTPLAYPNWAAKFLIDAIAELQKGGIGPDLTRQNMTRPKIRGSQERASPVSFPRQRLMSCTFDAVTEAGVIDWARSALNNGAFARGYISTVNVAILMMIRRDKRLRRFVENAALTVADGQPIIWLSQSLNCQLPERVTGVALTHSLADLCAREGKTLYLLGATNDVLRGTEQVLKRAYPDIRIAGRRNGYFSQDEAAQVAKDIKDSGADMLFVAMGVPRQDYFLARHWENLGVTVAIGVGGSFDVISGQVKRAPVWMQKTGLEWLFRLLQEPRRLSHRYALTNSEYIWLTFREFLRA